MKRIARSFFLGAAVIMTVLGIYLVAFVPFVLWVDGFSFSVVWHAAVGIWAILFSVNYLRRELGPREKLEAKREPRSLYEALSVPARMPGDDWPCYFCGWWRPDWAISVVSRDRGTVAGGVVEWTENRRYCNDNPECIDKAFAWRDE